MGKVYKMSETYEVNKTFSNREDAEKEKERIEGLFYPPPKEVWIEENGDFGERNYFEVFFKLD
jgi:hypothetical protein